MVGNLIKQKSNVKIEFKFTQGRTHDVKKSWKELLSDVGIKDDT